MATLTRARPTPARAQHFSRSVKGAPRDLSDVALVALAPAISQLREAKNGMQATTILSELVPQHLHGPIARYAVQHAANFDTGVVAAILHCVGWNVLAAATSEAAAEAAFARFLLPLQNAVQA